MTEIESTQVEGETYDGTALLRAAGGTSSPAREIPATVRLRGAFNPIDGRFHWHGRLDSHASQEFSSGSEVSISTSRGMAVGRLSDPDTWGRLRISGIGAPPF